MKKVVIAVVFIFAVVSLNSCRSKKKSCDYSKVEVKQNVQQLEQDVIVACIDEE